MLLLRRGHGNARDPVTSSPRRRKLGSLSQVPAALAAGTLTVILASGCGAAGGPAGESVGTGDTLAIVTTVPVTSRTVPKRWGEAFTAMARVAIREAAQGKVALVRCSATVTIVASGHRARTALCTAVADSTCGEWLVYRKGTRLEASLWRYRPLEICRRKTG
jgi:hypothetical protein